MQSFTTYLNETQTPRVLYRGVSGSYDTKFASRQKIIWLSTSEDHARMYAGTGDVVSYTVAGRPDPLDLGFRAAEIQVPFSEVSERFMTRIMDRFRQKKITRDVAIEIGDALDELVMSGSKQVWEWIHEPKLLNLIKKSGYNSIKQREGQTSLKGDIDTYGVLDYSIIKINR